MKKYFLMTMVFLIFLIPGFSKSQENEEPSKATVCCFDHDGYVGQCKVTPDEGETCQSILEYLNTAGTVGKTYCNNSKWRGGWTQVDCSQEGE